MNRFGIKVKILNFGNKIPNIPCLILTTSEELEKIKNPNENIVKILSYDKNEKFEKYITRLLAAYRIGYEDNYSELIFSIDPGTKNIGLVIFLDNYYLNSHTFYDIENLLKKIREYETYLQKNQISQIDLVFKIGMGVLETALEVVSNLFGQFKEFINTHVFLIDESKTSKIRIYSKEKKIPKHEVSALILALRDGIEINKENYVKVFTDIKNKKIRLIHYNNHFHNNNDISLDVLKDLILKILNGELSLTETYEKLIKLRIDKFE
ncbi:MAG: hypothetical protein ACFFBP_10850 [Promethearchaeota archaeon]